MTLSPEIVAKEYASAVDFNQSIDLYDTIETNENFFLGKQWEGVQSNGLPTPVFNFLKRVTLFQVANISSDNLKLNAKPLASTAEVEEATVEAFCDILNDQFAQIGEHNKLGGIVREMCRNAAVDGDGCTYTYWDPDVETGQARKGAIKTEVLLNTQVAFGNPNCAKIQKQPYIIIERRMMLEEAKKYAKRCGLSETDIDGITADEKESGNVAIDMKGGPKVTVLLRMWRDDDTGTIHAYETTKTVELRGEWDLGIKHYPVTWMNWDYVQDCYHGQAMITGLIPNQVFVNKLFAMAMISLMKLAFPTMIYDKTKIRSWQSGAGQSIGVNGSVDNVAKIMDPATISPQISQFIDAAISYTQKFLGASDVALGDTRPDNTSAIIALQRAAATPMELTRQNLLQSVEELGSIYIDFMSEYYGERVVEVDTKELGKVLVSFDFSALKDIPLSIDLDAGASAYWSEIASMQTLDNLLMNQQITLSEYLERLPAGQITNREALIEVARAREQGQMAQLTPDMMSNEVPMEGGTANPPMPEGSGYGALQRQINATGEVPKE